MSDIKIITCVSELPAEWDSFVKNDIFLKSDYLKALEKASPNNIQVYFVLIYAENLLAGIAIVQHVKLYLQDIFRKNTGNAFTRLFRRGVSFLLKGNILVVGNLTHTGQHGVCFNSNLISKENFVNKLFGALDDISELIKSKEKKNIRLYLFKDYFVDHSLINDDRILKKEKLYKVKVQPNMVLELRPSWNSIDDYYIDLNKKYKRRYRTARKKLGDTIQVEMSIDDIENRSMELDAMYRNVSDNAKLNMFLLPKDHFLILKKHLGERFKVFGFFLGDQLIGFYTLILNYEILETYFLGYKKEHQFQKQLYLNMLFNMLQFGIDNNLKEIVYARTAMEIKSSVGAKRKDMIMYIKHTDKTLNRFMEPVFDLLDPTSDWAERHPFD